MYIGDYILWGCKRQFSPKMGQLALVVSLRSRSELLQFDVNLWAVLCIYNTSSIYWCESCIAIYALRDVFSRVKVESLSLHRHRHRELLKHRFCLHNIPSLLRFCACIGNTRLRIGIAGQFSLFHMPLHLTYSTGFYSNRHSLARCRIFRFVFIIIYYSSCLHCFVAIVRVPWLFVDSYTAQNTGQWLNDYGTCDQIRYTWSIYDGDLVFGLFSQRKRSDQMWAKSNRI